MLEINPLLLCPFCELVQENTRHGLAFAVVVIHWLKLVPVPVAAVVVTHQPAQLMAAWADTEQSSRSMARYFFMDASNGCYS